MTDTQTPTYPTASGDKLTATRVPLGTLRFARRAVQIMGRDGYGNPAVIGQRYENVLQELCEVGRKKYWFDIPVESEIYD